MKIYLVRHGMDDESFRGGWSDFGLERKGRKQSKKLAKYLYKNIEKFNINTLISSDLRRCVETSESISCKMDLRASYKSKWREIDNGLLSGMPNEIAKSKYPKLYFNTLGMDEKYPDGESPAEYFERIKNAFNELCTNMKSSEISPDVMIVTHFGVINIIYHILNDDKWTNKSDKWRKISYTGIHTIEYKDDKWIVTATDELNHL